MVSEPSMATANNTTSASSLFIGSQPPPPPVINIPPPPPDFLTATSTSFLRPPQPPPPPLFPAISFPPSPLDQISPITISTPIKLTYNNYLTWQAQILPIVNGYNFTRFLTSSPPNPTRPTSEGHIEFNQEYLLWSRQDQLLLGWLRSSISESIQAQLVSCTTSASLWSCLQQQFASTSRAKLIDLKRKLQTISKGTSSCTEFLEQLRRIADELAFIGAPVSDDDLVLAAIHSLGSDYNSFVAAITATNRHDSISFSDFNGMLLSHEALLRGQQSTLPSSSSLPSAFAITSAHGFTRGTNRFHPNQSRQVQGGFHGTRPNHSSFNFGPSAHPKPHHPSQPTFSFSQNGNS